MVLLYAKDMKCDASDDDCSRLIVKGDDDARQKPAASAADEGPVDFERAITLTGN